MQLAEDIASALEHCHAQRPPVVHRDLSGRNVLLAGDGRSARLADFGLAAAKRRTYLSSDKVKRWNLCLLGCAGRAVQLVAHSGMLPLVCLVLSGLTGLTVPLLFGVFAICAGWGAGHRCLHGTRSNAGGTDQRALRRVCLW